MKNVFIPTKRLQSRYCVWVKTGNPRQPLECVWIDLEMRSFQNMGSEKTSSLPTASSEAEREKSSCTRRKAPLASRRFAALRATRHFFEIVARFSSNFRPTRVALRE
jgi:hypothetical protein